MSDTQIPQQGDKVTFKAYGDDSVEALLTAGSEYEVHTSSPDGDGFVLEVFVTDDKGQRRLDGDGQPMLDTVFDTEIEPWTPPVAEETETETETETEAEAEVDISKMKKAELVEHAKSLGLKFDSKITVKALRELITNPPSAEEADEAEEAEAAAPVEDETPAETDDADVEPEAEAEAAETAEAAPPPATPGVRNTDTEAVRDLVTKGDLLASAQELVNKSNETDFTLGGVLAHIYNQRVYVTLGDQYEGKSGFEAYCEQELGVRYRKAMYLKQMYEFFTAAGTDEKRLSKIGWTKAREIMTGNVNDVDAMLDFAEKNTRDALIAEIGKTKQSLDGSSGDTVEKRKFTFTLTGMAGANAETALNTAKQLTGSDDNNVAFEHIMTEWATTSEVELPLEDVLASIEARYKVSLRQMTEEEIAAVEQNADAEDDQSEAEAEQAAA